MSVYEIKPGNVVRYLAKNPPAGHTWPVRGNLYRVRNVKEAKVAIDPIDGNEDALRYAVWVPTESVEYVSNVDPFLKKNKKTEKEANEPAKEKAKDLSTDKHVPECSIGAPSDTEACQKAHDSDPHGFLGELEGIQWPLDEDGKHIKLGENVFFSYGKDRICRRGVFFGVGISDGKSVIFAKYGRAFRCIPCSCIITKPTSNSINSRIERLCEQLTPEQQAELKKILEDKSRVMRC